MKRIPVRVKDHSYQIIIAPRLIKKTGVILRRFSLGKDACVITNATLHRLLKNPLTRSLNDAGITARFFLVPDSEKAKSEKTANALFCTISAYDKKRSIFVIALGGGVIGDVAGFVASVYKRGVPYVQIPTTLLAQVDSAIGGKVAIDLPIAKNLIGAFYQPRVVISDIDLLGTLPERQLKNGMGEVIKYGVIKDRALFSYVERSIEKILGRDRTALERIIARASTIKARIVEKDEFDTKGIRAVLNYGHTIGHAIEATAGYSRAYTHGEAIAIGMVVANEIAVRLGCLKQTEALRIKRLIEAAGLPTRMRPGLSLDRLLESHLRDKKFKGAVNRFILPTSIGSARVVENIPGSLIREAVKRHLSR